MWIASYIALGTVTGFFAGLFGIGGGGIMVPVLAFLFLAQNFPDAHVVHLALGTSLAAIVPTALASLAAHQRHGAVLWPVAVRMTPGVLLGTFGATFLAARLAAEPLAIFFAGFMGWVAVQLVLDRRPNPARNLPGAPGLGAAGAGIGGVSALVALGGGAMTVPFLVWCNVRLQTAIGTSAALGLPIALAGACGYMLNGWPIAGLPAQSLGFVYWPAVLAIASVSFITAPLGARLAHRLPVKQLKRWFALLLALLSLQMLYQVLGNP